MEGNLQNLKDLLLCLGPSNKLDQVNFPLRQHTCTKLGTFEEHLSSHICPPLYWLQVPGYYIKADHYKASDWDWLITKVEKRVSHWCNRWLTIGGRYTLIKSVLEGQPIYWMALAAIPISVLDKLRSLTYRFLWSGSKDQHKIHLCNWESIAKPKSKGDWGIRNIFKFNQALVASSLWRALTSSGIWSAIIKDKYLPFTSVASWLRAGLPPSRNASRTWRIITKSAHWITKGFAGTRDPATP
jgi:hypothetical protein